MIILLALALVADQVPTITVVQEGDHYRVAVDFFRQSQAEEVDAAVESRVTAACGGKAAKTIATDFETIDPANDRSGAPPVERAIWNYWRTFACVDGGKAFE